MPVPGGAGDSVMRTAVPACSAVPVVVISEAMVLRGMCLTYPPLEGGSTIC